MCFNTTSSLLFIDSIVCERYMQVYMCCNVLGLIITHTNTGTGTCKHAYTQPYTQSHIQTCACSRAHKCIHIQAIHTRTPSLNTYTHACTHMRSYKHTLSKQTLNHDSDLATATQAGKTVLSFSSRGPVTFGYYHKCTCYVCTQYTNL